MTLLGAVEVRELATRAGIRPTKALGQNFVHDANTVRRIVRSAALDPADVVLEVGPGLGSLTLGLLPEVDRVYAVEIDPALAGMLPATVARHDPAHAEQLTVINTDALRLAVGDLDPGALDRGALDPGGLDRGAPDPGATSAKLLGRAAGTQQNQPSCADLDGAPTPTTPTALVANLPYNVAVPVILHLLAEFPTLRHGLVMVQKEVADRLTAAPGSKIYGVPSVKLAWYASSRQAGTVPASVFWPVPNVESGLVAFTRRNPPPTDADRGDVFAVVNAAFAQRRKTLRAALAGWAGGADAAAEILLAAGVDPGARGEALTVAQFAAIAGARASVRPAG